MTTLRLRSRVGGGQAVTDGGGGGGSDYLDGVIASTCCDLDATISASYGGTGQTWSNLVTSPADGAGQTDYDFWVGVDGTSDTTDATFTGTAGDPAAYWSMDNTDFFNIKSFSSATTLYNGHKSGGSGSTFWVALAYRANSNAVAAGWGSSWTIGDIGFYGYFDANGLRRLYRGTSTTLDNASETVLANDWDGINDDVLVIVSADFTTTTNNVRIWTNSSTSVLLSNDFGTNTETANNSFFIGATASTPTTPEGTQAASARIYHFSCGNAFITDTDAGNIASHLGTRHSRTYY